MSDDVTIKDEKYWEWYDEKQAEESRQRAAAEANKKYNFSSGNKKKDNDQTKPLPVFPTYKYSKPVLHEAVIIDGLPSFLKYDPTEDKLLKVEKIEESSRVLRPPNREEYPYTPYEFTDGEELNRYLLVAKDVTIDELYESGKTIVRKYNDQDDYKLNLISIDIIWSYFQDKFPNTHYIGVTGDNNSGKSSIGYTFGAVGYRAVNMTSPTVANIYRALGLIELGQCTLVLDESERISEDPFILEVLKTGYTKGGKVPKINNTNNYKQEWFYTYCFKIVIGGKVTKSIQS
jgi:hypothetical protein